MDLYRKISIASGVFLALIAILVGTFFYRMHYWGKQINNLILFQAYESALQEYYKNHASYPMDLSETFQDLHYSNASLGFDYWGHPLHYEQKGSQYILVSFGRDGKSDGLDYWILRDAIAKGGKNERICGRWNADQVLSDVGWVRVCGK